MINKVNIKKASGVTNLSRLVIHKLSSNQSFNNSIFNFVITNKLANTNWKAFVDRNNYSKKSLETYYDPKL